MRKERKRPSTVRLLTTKQRAAIDADPYAPKPLTEVADIIFSERGRLSPTEFVVAMQEAGCRPDANPRRLVAALRNTVRRYPNRFAIGDGGRWSSA